jgi:hypothetical protein
LEHEIGPASPLGPVAAADRGKAAVSVDRDESNRNSNWK